MGNELITKSFVIRDSQNAENQKVCPLAALARTLGSGECLKQESSVRPLVLGLRFC
jgi:hypothetical protein